VSIDYGQVRNLTARELISALVRDGFGFDRGSGSHQIYYHTDGRRVTVPFHRGSSTFARKTLKSIIETQARWTEGDLKRLRLIYRRE
jgi:predicted RNA binding protein YcfA (HicA-like mRNA interferase family)